MHKIAMPGSQTRAATFDQPFEMLDACHERVRRSLDLLQRVVQHAAVHGADPQARAAAGDVLRYFTLAAPAHHEDEERHVVPLLRTSGDAQAMVTAQQMLDDHVRIRAAWAELEPALKALAEGAMPEFAALRRAAQQFVDVHTDHLLLEDRLAFPHAQERLTRQGPRALQAMGDEMAERRGVRKGGV